jgi:hypothetical protein
MGSAAIDNGDRSWEGVPAMKGIKATAILVLGLPLILAVALPAIAKDQRRALFKQYWGIIRSIRIDRCGTQPGLCEGAIILAQRVGGEMTLAIRSGIWIKPGDRLVLLEELCIGHNVHVQAVEITTEIP